MDKFAEKFVQAENLSRFQNLLRKVTDEGQRNQIKILIAEETAKGVAPKLKSPGE